jgi:transcriptional regulator with XRE-family HTH domain
MDDANALKNSGFPARLRKLRKEKDISQTELGKLAGLHYTHIGRYERGSSYPTADSLRRLADALGVSADFLLHGNIESAAKANFSDRELLLMFQEIEKLPDEDRDFIKRVIDALLTKKKIQALAKTGS